jgi:hypothetical protein
MTDEDILSTGYGNSQRCFLVFLEMYMSIDIYGHGVRSVRQI